MADGTYIPRQRFLLTRAQVENGIKEVVNALDYDLYKEVEAGEGDHSFESLIEIFQQGTEA